MRTAAVRAFSDVIVIFLTPHVCPCRRSMASVCFYVVIPNPAREPRQAANVKISRDGGEGPAFRTQSPCLRENLEIARCGLGPWRIERGREVPGRIRNCYHHRNRSCRGEPRQLHARWQIERRNRRSQSIIRHRPRLAAHRAMVHARRAVPAFHLHRMMPAAARHRAFLRRTHLTSRHQRQRHRQQRQNQTHSLYPPHHFCSRIISAL